MTDVRRMPIIHRSHVEQSAIPMRVWKGRAVDVDTGENESIDCRAHLAEVNAG